MTLRKRLTRAGSAAAGVCAGAGVCVPTATARGGDVPRREEVGGEHLPLAGLIKPPLQSVKRGVEQAVGGRPVALTQREQEALELEGDAVVEAAPGQVRSLGWVAVNRCQRQ